MNHGGNSATMEDLDDDMLTQILFRLPNSATVQACSPVNKRWCSLISDPNFGVQFDKHKKKATTLLMGSGSGHEGDAPPLTFITTMQSSEQPLITEFIFGSPNSLEFSPCNTFTPRATFKDLVLCSSSCGIYRIGGRVYYITNPLTKQWVALPPYPVYMHQQKRLLSTSLICQPPSNHNQDYKFRVVEIRNFRMECGPDTCYLIVYCSEIGKWRKINVRLPKEARPIRAPETVVCNGIIYFKSGLCLVAFDPFDVNDDCHMTLEAKVMPPLPDFGYLQESSGQLLVVHTPKRHRRPCLWYKKDGTDIELQMVVWKLDLNQALLAWETTFEGLCKGTGNSIESLYDTILGGNIDAEDIWVHPYNDHLIYMYLTLENQFVLCDTQTGCITLSNSLCNTYGRRFHRLEHQWWPTSVPAVVKIVEQKMRALQFESSDDSECMHRLD